MEVVHPYATHHGSFWYLKGNWDRTRLRDAERATRQRLPACQHKHNVSYVTVDGHHTDSLLLHPSEYYDALAIL